MIAVDGMQLGIDAEPRNKKAPAPNAIDVLSGARTNHASRKAIAHVVGTGMLEDQAMRVMGGRGAARGLPATGGQYSFGPVDDLLAGLYIHPTVCLYVCFTALCYSTVNRTACVTTTVRMMVMVTSCIM